MLTSYATFAGTELWNHERLLSYMLGNIEIGFLGLRTPNTSVNRNCYCATAHCLYCDQGSGPNGAYQSPELDDAPWYDPNEPGSAEFAGLFVEDINGFDGTVAREVTDGAIFGTSLGPLRLRGRSMTVTGWLRAKSCCGAEYGLRWLQEALMGTADCQGCSLGDLYMVKCCPPDSDTCHLSPVQTATLNTTTTLEVSVTDNGDGLYAIVLSDANMTGVVAMEGLTPNNVLGYVPVAFNNNNTWKGSFTAGDNDVPTFEVPWMVVNNFATAPAGDGTSATIDVDVSATSDCEDEQAQIERLAAALAEFVFAHGSGVVVAMNPVGQGHEFEVVEGINPLDYVRLMHRVGLTDGVKVIERQGTCCSDCGCTNLKVQFTLTSELPYIFSDITWCADQAVFPLDEYCLNLRKLCGQCVTPIGTTRYARQVARPECGITLRHNQTWCADGWDTADGCPPTDCLLTVQGTTEFTPTTETTEPCAPESGLGPNECKVGLNSDGSWGEFPVGTWDVVDGFPPPFCTLSVFGSNFCDPGSPASGEEPEVPPDQPCLVSVTYNACTGEKTWEPIRWNGVLPDDNGNCPCLQIAETCYITCADEGVDPCPDPRECPINVNCDGTWEPVGWVFDQDAAFPDPDCTYTIATVNDAAQDTSLVTEYIEIPSDEFVADCGPLPIPPPAPFLITSNCYCEPWVSRRMCCTFTNPGDWNEATTYIEIYTGSEEMRSLKIEAYQNPFGDAVPCPCDPNDEFWECREPCASIAVPQLPASSRLIIDSRLRTAQLVLSSGKTVNAMRYLFTADGAPFSWFDLGQCSTFCVVISVSSMAVADDVEVSVGMVTRYLASGW